MIIEINIPEWIAYIGVMIIAMWAADKTLLLIKKWFEWRVEKAKQFTIRLTENYYEKGDILKTHTYKDIVIVRKQYERKWEKLFCWLSKRKYFNNNGNNGVVYIVKLNNK